MPASSLFGGGDGGVVAASGSCVWYTLVLSTVRSCSHFQEGSHVWLHKVFLSAIVHAKSMYVLVTS